jgi:hypothetical protein
MTLHPPPLSLYAGESIPAVTRMWLPASGPQRPCCDQSSVQSSRQPLENRPILHASVELFCDTEPRLASVRPCSYSREPFFSPNERRIGILWVRKEHNFDGVRMQHPVSVHHFKRTKQCIKIFFDRRYHIDLTSISSLVQGIKKCDTSTRIIFRGCVVVSSHLRMSSEIVCWNVRR